MKVLVAILLTLGGCATVKAQWDRDGGCIPICADYLQAPAEEVLATRDANGVCVCDRIR